MKSKLYYYIISVTGYETYSLTTVIHTKRMSKKAFYKLVKDTLIQLLVDGWEPYDFEVPEKVAEALIINYGFKLLRPVCEYNHEEFTFFNWVTNFKRNLYNLERAMWVYNKAKPPRWLPKSVIDLVETKIISQVKTEEREEKEVSDE